MKPAKPKHAHSLYCPSCASLEVVEGALDADRFFPKRGFIRALLAQPLRLTSSQAYACLQCGLLWHRLDPDQLASNTSRYGLAPHRTAVMQAVAIKPHKAV